MAIELVLKLTGRVESGFFELQEAWQNKSDGSFCDFDHRTFSGLTFRRQFGNPRDDQFPIDSLFAAIDKELESSRYVIISLPSGPGWHMYVIYGVDAAGDYRAVSKSSSSGETILKEGVKETVRQVKGTDILTYLPSLAK